MKFLKVLVCLFLGISMVGCSNGSEKKIIVYSTAEDFRNEFLQKKLDEKFSDYKVEIQYLSTGNCAAKLKAEGKKIEADIIFEMEKTYADELKDNFYTLSDYDYSKYLDELVPSDKKYATSIRYSAAIILNEKVLKEKGLDIPKTYEDLLNPKYKGLISMPNPKASGTGYMILKNIINIMGEEKGFAYFDDLSKNILQYTSSGSGPVNALVQGEVGIGLGMTFQAVNEINKGSDLSIKFFDEGAPWTTSTFAIVDGHQDKEGVKEVFQYFYDELILMDKEKFLPETIYKVQDTKIINYPENIKYGDMSNNTPEEREKLLSKWKY
ncbi:MAG: extracellular solute-binding protein [Coprobacillus sp.]